MTAPATELQKLLELRDAGAVTDAEFAAMKSRILHPERHVLRPVSGRSDGLFSGARGWMIGVGVLIGGTTLAAMTEAGAMAIGAITLVCLAVLAVFALADF